MSTLIVDRKKKRRYYMMDSDVKDPLGIEEIHKNKKNTIEIPKGSKNPAHQILTTMGAGALIGRKAFCFNDRKEMVSGFITSVLPPFYIHLKNKGVFKLEDVVSIGG